MSKSLEGAFASLVGKSENFLSAVDQVHIASRSDATILLLGETGTGKELAARAIHYGGPRSGRPFVPVHCGAVPDHLFENELFGHVKGAFTDASTPTKGLIEEAEGGTLFLDEVDTLTPAAQIKLLRFLQDGHYRPLGSSKDHVADVRVITASNSDLKALVESEKFRKDLFYRISSLAIELPPLRERPTDIPVLAMHFLRMFEQELGSIPRELSASAIQSLLIHYWPGNVRELRGMIHKAILMNQSGSLTARDFQFQGEKERQLSVFKEAKSDAVRRFEQEYVINLLRLHGGNLTLAADRAGTDRRVLQRLLQKHSLDRSEFASTA
ncbi:MAG TPA: sigma-54 dependent transcriptional regulator [Bacteroidota bacterium]